MTQRNYDFLVGVETDVLPGAGRVDSIGVFATSTSYTILNDDNYGTIVVEDTTADRTITLPEADNNTSRKIKIIHAADEAGNVIIDGNGAETINGLATFTLYRKFDNITVQSDGTKWFILDSIPAGSVKFYESTGTNYAEIEAPSNIASAYTVTWPNAVPLASQFLRANAVTPKSLEWATFTGASFTVAAKTADYTILSSESSNSTVFTNTGATGKVTLTLPSASPGYCIYFIVTEAYEMQIDTASGDYIYLQNNIQLEKTSNSTKGKILIIYAIDSTSWFGINADSWIDANALGFFCGGNTGSYSNIIDYFSVSVLGNATDFGDLTVARDGLAGCSSSTRGIMGGGNTGSNSNVIDYFPLSSPTNATDFGDLTVAKRQAGCCSNSTRGVWGGGFDTSTTSAMEYITIASLGNGAAFGSLTLARDRVTGLADQTRGVFAGGASYSNVMDYIAIASTGNATDFGDLTVARRSMGGVSSSTRGIWGGGFTGAHSNILDYITISTTGNATDFGDLTVARNNISACCSKIRGVWGGGDNTGRRNEMDYIAIASLGNASSFGTLSSARDALGGCSSAHGGI